MWFVAFLKRHFLFLFEEHLTTQGLGDLSGKKKNKEISFFFNFVAIFKVALCSSVSWQRSLCSVCTYVRDLLNKYSVSSVFSIPSEMKCSIPSCRTCDKQKKSQTSPMRKQQNQPTKSDFSCLETCQVLSNCDEVFQDVRLFQCTGWQESDWTRAEQRAGCVGHVRFLFCFCRIHQHVVSGAGN